MTTDLSQVFAALADPTRRDIVARLATAGEATVTELAEPYAVSMQAVSKHIGVLEQAGLVRRRVDGATRPVALAADALGGAEDWLERYRRRAEARYRRLDELLSRTDDRPPTDDPQEGRP